MKEEKFLNIVKLGERQYKINQFNPFDGGYVALFVIKKIVPLLKAFDLDISKIALAGDSKNVNEAFSEIVDLAMPILNSVTKEELQDFMATCLSKVEVLLPAGYVQVYRSGVFALEEIEYSTKTCFLLCFHAIRPLIADFFGENALSLIKNFKATTNQ